MEDLCEINKKIERIKNAEYVRAYYRKNPDKRKECNAKWNKVNRKEYQRAYRAKNK